MLRFLSDSTTTEPPVPTSPPSGPPNSTNFSLRKLAEPEPPPFLFICKIVWVDEALGAQQHNATPEAVQFIHADKEERWKAINQTKNFWANLDWMPNAKRLYDFIIRYEPHILSAYSTKDANSRKGKMNWLRKEAKLTQKSRIHLVLREDKQKFAMTNGKPNLLIDDYIKNVNEWKAVGGVAIHHTSGSNTIAELKRLGF